MNAPITDRDLVVATLHHNGELVHTITARTANTVRRFADGFGTGLFLGSPRKWDEKTRDMFSDWSSVRDSSATAFTTMAAIIRQNLVSA
jgi:hypothetical protein